MKITLTPVCTTLIALFVLGCADKKDSWTDHPVWYKDSDQPVGFVSNADDLNDDLPCDEALTFYRDSDGDGLGDPNSAIEACEAPEGYVDNYTDADDTKSVS